MRKPTIVLVALALGMAACGGDAVETTTTTTNTSTTTTTIAPTTTTTAPTTTTTIDLGPVSPISGLPVDDPETLAGRALVVKIDNHPNARPQTGILEADAVIELSVEGITRFAALVHTADIPVLGPMRSVRPTDYQIANLVGGPLVISGGQDWVRAANRSGGAELIGETGPPQTFRSNERNAPHNLYIDAGAMQALADNRGYSDEPPQQIWEFGELPEGGEPATRITLDFSSSLVAGWEWNGEQYLRTTNGAVHEWVDSEGNRSQIAVDTLVVLYSETFLQSGPTGGPARAVVSIGTGRALVFADGLVVEGEWSREESTDPFTLTTIGGATLTVPPGLPWISLFPDDRTVDW